MKTYDIYLDDGVKPANVMLSGDALSYDIFLQDRLTRLDVIISTLISRENLTYYDKLILDCVMSELRLHASLRAQTSMAMQTELRQFAARVYAASSAITVLHSEAEFLKGTVISADTQMSIGTIPLDIVRGISDSFEGYQTITATIDTLDANYSLGKAEFANLLRIAPLDTEKQSFLSSDIHMSVFGKVDLAGNKVLSPNNMRFMLGTEPVSLYDLAIIMGDAVLGLCSEMLYDARLIKSVSTQSTVGYRVSFADDLRVYKAISGNSDIHLLSSVVWMLNKVIYPNFHGMRLGCEASAAFYRKRKLRDMDSFKLSDFDSMTLGEVDYIEI